MILATNFKSDAKGSRALFEKFTRPALEYSGFKNIHSVENGNEQLENLLDRNGGIDVAGTKDGDLIFLASRVIKIEPEKGSDYDCFSLRNLRLSGNETEISKLERKIRLGLPRPQYHVQTFIDEILNLATIAIVRTRELVQFIITHKTKTKTTRDGTEFRLATWKDLISSGVHVDLIKIDADGKKISRS